MVKDRWTVLLDKDKLVIQASLMTANNDPGGHLANMSVRVGDLDNPNDVVGWGNRNWLQMELQHDRSVFIFSRPSYRGSRLYLHY